MGGLYHTLNIGAESLYATRQGVDTAGHNIANAQTEGYSRQRVDLTQREPSETRGVIIGNGAYVDTISRAHDQYVEKQLNNANQGSGETAARFEALKAMEGIYSPELNANIGDELSSFFQAIQDVANFPEELTVRTHLREVGTNLANSFKHVDTALRDHQKDLSQRLIGETEEINGMLEKISDLNIQIAALEEGNRKVANDLRDQQDGLLRNLSTRMDINYYRSDNNMMVVRGPADTLLVERGAYSKLGVEARQSNSNLSDIVVIGADGNMKTNITEVNRSGRLKGILDVRDRIIEDMALKNNTLARSVADEVNAIHKNGYGLSAYKNTTGRAFWEISSDINQAAKSLAVSQEIIDDTDAISMAVTPNAAGDNVNANNLLRLQTARVLNNNNSSLMEYFANGVGNFGLEIVRADHDKQAADIVVSDLKSRREAVSGVSMDEEATNLMRWQSNFTASSRVITTVDEMLETVLSLKR